MAQSLFEANGETTSRSEAGTPPSGHETDRQGARKISSGASDRSGTPVSRTATPAVAYPSNIAPQHLFDNVAGPDYAYQQSPSITALNMRKASSGSNCSLNDRHTELSVNNNELRQAKTRISELELVNDLFKGRVSQLEADTHQAEILQRKADTQLRYVYEQSQARENALKREIEELKREIMDLKDLHPHGKRQRLSQDSSAVAPSLTSAA